MHEKDTKNKLKTATSAKKGLEKRDFSVFGPGTDSSEITQKHPSCRKLPGLTQIHKPLVRSLRQFSDCRTFD